MSHRRPIKKNTTKIHGLHANIHVTLIYFNLSETCRHLPEATWEVQVMQRSLHPDKWDRNKKQCVIVPCYTEITHWVEQLLPPAPNRKPFENTDSKCHLHFLVAFLLYLTVNLGVSHTLSLFQETLQILNTSLVKTTHFGFWKNTRKPKNWFLFPNLMQPCVSQLLPASRWLWVVQGKVNRKLKQMDLAPDCQCATHPNNKLICVSCTTANW